MEVVRSPFVFDFVMDEDALWFRHQKRSLLQHRPFQAVGFDRLDARHRRRAPCRILKQGRDRLLISSDHCQERVHVRFEAVAATDLGHGVRKGVCGVEEHLPFLVHRQGSVVAGGGAE